MEYRIEALASHSGVRVDTIRFYQGRGLLPPPRREGRIALYDEAHLERLRRIRRLLADGLSLQLIRRVLAAEASAAPDREPLLAALVEEQVGRRTLCRAELASEAGVPEALIGAAQAAGLVQPLRIGDEERFSEADLQMARAGLALLGAGLPLGQLIELAVQHARATQELAERAIDLFDRHVRRPDGTTTDVEAVTTRFRELLPQATRLVALFFQRTLVTRALARLEGAGDGEALRAAIAATESARLEVRWK
ncbi:MAG: MerR family transcriptional regulator [Deltaproteobacteria bacterium]|nr:MerR family transcriptional regulator [Deltaproteobacteria bacterium]